MKYLFWVLLIIYSHKTYSQVSSSNYNISVGVQVTLNYKLGIYTFKQNFPGIRAFVGFNSSNELVLSKRLKGSFNFGTSLCFYNKALGNSLNIDFQDNQIDWTNNFSLGLLWGNSVPTRLLQTMNNVPFLIFNIVLNMLLFLV